MRYNTNLLCFAKCNAVYIVAITLKMLTNFHNIWPTHLAMNAMCVQYLLHVMLQHKTYKMAGMGSRQLYRGKGRGQGREVEAEARQSEIDVVCVVLVSCTMHM